MPDQQQSSFLDALRAVAEQVAAKVGGYFTPDPQMQEVGRVLKEQTAGAANPVHRLMTNFLIDQGVDSTTPGGAALNMLDVGPLAKGAGAAMAAASPKLAKALKAAGEAVAASRGLYSRVDEAAKLIPAKGAHPNKVASLLKSNASGEELAYRKMQEFLASKGNATVTPAELLDHLAANPAPMPTVKTLAKTPDTVTNWLERNNQGIPQTPEEWTHLSAQLERTAQGWQRKGDAETANRFFGFAEDASRHAEGVSTTTGSTAGQPKFASYQLPGGENYRETLQTLQRLKEPVNYELQQAFTQANEDLNAFRRSNPEAELEGLRNPEYRQLVMARNRLGEQLTASENAHVAQMFRGGHFDEPNVLVHTRSNERTLPTGERGRFIEEVQSDWHQKGKKQGYRATPEDTQAMGARLDAIRAEKEALAQQRDPRTNVMLDESRWHALSNEQDALIDRYNRTVNDAVPDAPFKDSWPDLGLKQHVLEAADDPAAQWIGFTGGGTQAARYDLSKQVQQIDYRRTREGLYELGAVDLEGEGIRLPKSTFTAEELPDVVGKEVADKIISGQGQPGGGRMTLRGLDLKVGGEGMRHFYDQLLPKRLEKILRPFGGKVEPFRLTHEAHPSSGADTETSAAWMAFLTPEMKERIRREGLPLLSMLGLAHLAQAPLDQPQERPR